MTTEERIAELDAYLDKALHAWPAQKIHHERAGMLAVACELRALRLMLREEIREASWRLRSEA